LHVSYKSCRTFQFAVNQTAAGGEVKALDPADYSPVTINKSISIAGVVGAGIHVTSPNQAAISISTLNGATINVANLILDGPNPPSGQGVFSTNGQGSSLTIENCIIRNFDLGIIAGGPFGSSGLVKS
jgi:hypothetical protein